jgi:polysaccharide pyruvyl transferase WcaK-like protein
MALREFLKEVIPPILINRVRQIKKARHLKIATVLKTAWADKRADIQCVRKNLLPPHRVVIIPGDQTNLFESCGEDAMIMATASMVLQTNPAAEITVLVTSKEAEAAGRLRGFRTASVWNDGEFVDSLVHFYRELGPDAIFIVGADLIDGYYGEIWAAKLLIAADIAARMEIPVSILGFSFNRNPSPLILDIMNELHQDVVLNVREETSLERLHRLTTARGIIVADSAFSLQAEITPSVEATASWVALHQRTGQKVVAFNIHPMLFPRASRDQIEALIEKSAEALSEVSRLRQVAWLLLPHDFREKLGDETCLKPLMNRLQPSLGNDIRYFEDEHLASVLKGVSGTLDGIVTARMHLAIAGLGQRVPVAGLAYQDKFEGLFGHFELPEEFLLSPSAVLEGNNLRELLLRFYDNIPLLKEMVIRRLPAVTAMSEVNFRILQSGQLATRFIR